MTPLRFSLRNAAALAPGIDSLATLRAIARGEQAHAHVPLTLPAPAQLPAAERRRASQAVRLALACIAQVLDPTADETAPLRCVFATDEGTGEISQQMLQALATTRQVSPLVFTNSVHNAPSGYFAIASRNVQSATTVSLGLESFACGLMCAVAEAMATQAGVLLVACDPAMTAPMDEVLPIRDGTACAWIVDPHDGAAASGSLGRFAMTLEPCTDDTQDTLAPWLPAEWRANSSARGLAALGLLDAPAGTRLRLRMGAQCLALWREETAP
jgi:hypothetical protein